MSISINSILEVKPNTWSNESYTGRNCVTVELSSYTTEYIEIENALRGAGITSGVSYNSISKIERVQHPFAYGRYLLRREQLERRNGYLPSSTRKFYKVSTNEVKEALEYNMDDRRTPSISAISPYYNPSLHDACLVITQRLDSKSRDSEEYPEYVIYFC